MNLGNLFYSDFWPTSKAIVIVIVIVMVSGNMPWVAMGSRPINCS